MRDEPARAILAGQDFLLGSWVRTRAAVIKVTITDMNTATMYVMVGSLTSCEQRLN